MCRTRLGAIALLVCCSICQLPAAESQPRPPIDKARFEAYVRYAEGFTPKVQVSVDDPTPSAYKDFSRIVVHATLGSQKFIRTYYVTADGRHFVNGSIWELNESPYLDVIQQLPANGPAFGPENAKVTIVVFSDFECPYCRQLAQAIRGNVPKKYPNEVRVVFADFPLDPIHPWARPMAEAAHCLTDGNPVAFWKFHDWVFEHQEEIKPDNLKEKVLGYAKDQGLDAAKSAACMDSHTTAKEVRESQEKADLLQVQQTPTLFINGRMLSGAVPWSTIDAVIQLELNRPKDIATDASPSCCAVSGAAVPEK